MNMRIGINWLGRAVWVVLSASQLSVITTLGQSNLDLVFADYGELEERKASIHQGDAKAVSDYQDLIHKADRALDQSLLSVTHKRRVAPSGDQHDYLSLAPYWWPDPRKPDGLPYVRRDGRVNPETRGDYVDYPAKQRLFRCVETLGLAAFYSEDPRYARKAVALLEAWFLDPETRMKPHLEYAQGVPGRSDGRGYGIIEWCDIDKLITPIQLLRAGDSIPESSYKPLVGWFAAYLDWLQTSEKGRFERDRLNNHGTWYDVQVAGLLLFLDRKPEAQAVLEQVKAKRIATQIEPDGRQPHELARTKSLSYSKMNLKALIRLARLAEKTGVELWEYETSDGRSIRRAEAFLAPYVNGQKKWEYPQLD